MVAEVTGAVLTVGTAMLAAAAADLMAFIVVAAAIVLDLAVKEYCNLDDKSAASIVGAALDCITGPTFLRPRSEHGMGVFGEAVEGF